MRLPLDMFFVIFSRCFLLTNCVFFSNFISKAVAFPRCSIDEMCETAGCEVYNLGTGKGTSVLEMVAAFEKASGKVSC